MDVRVPSPLVAADGRRIGKLSSFLYAFYPRRKPLRVTMTTPKVTPAKIGRSHDDINPASEHVPPAGQ